MLKQFQDSTTGLNIHIHLVAPSSYLLKHRQALLPGFSEMPSTVAIALLQAKEELAGESNAIATEKDRLLAQFLLFAQTVREKSNFATEIICPRSGFPLFSQQGKKHFDLVAIVYHALNISFQPTGDGCKVLSYLDWQTAVYPGLFLASASIPEVAAILKEIGFS